MELPQRVLYDAVAERTAKMTVSHAVFTTFALDPQSFENDILPVIFDIPLRATNRIRLAQLEDALLGLPGGVALYFDPRALMDQAARLNVQRVQVNPPRGYFHPKITLILGTDSRLLPHLVCSIASANLTEAGWQTNLETAHLLEFDAGTPHPGAEPLNRLLKWLLRQPGTTQAAKQVTSPISQFLSQIPASRKKRVAGRVLDQVWVGGVQGSETLGQWLHERIPAGSNLEAIAPTLDGQAAAARELVEQLNPKRFVVAATGDLSDVQIRAHESVPNLVWGSVRSGKLGRMGEAADAADRFVHAKLVRAYDQADFTDLIVVGSANLTDAACNNKNVEAMVLTDASTNSKPQPWLSAAQKPLESTDPSSESTEAPNTVIDVLITYDWVSEELAIDWTGAVEPPALTITGHAGVLASVAGGKPHRMVRKNLDHFRTHLLATAVVTVRTGTGSVGLVLVHEIGSSARPSIASTLTPGEVLEFWATLSPSRRAEILSDLTPVLPTDEVAETDIVRQHAGRLDESSFFSRTAAVFYAFKSFEQRVVSALARDGNSSPIATALVFGEKFDSLGTYIDQLGPGRPNRDGFDDVDRLIHLTSARNTRDRLRAAHPEFFEANKRAARRLEARLAMALDVLHSVEAANPELSDFLVWWTHEFKKSAVLPS